MSGSTEDRFLVPQVSAEAGGEEQLTAERLAAVRLLLDRHEKEVATHDILLATAFEFLNSGPKTIDEILTKVNREWPGVAVTRTMVSKSLEAAAGRGLVTQPDRGFGTAEAWKLLSAGRAQTEAAYAWGQDVVARTNSFLADEARKRFGLQVTEEVIHAWGTVLRDALFAGIGKAFTMNPRGVKVVGDSLLFPSAYDLDFIRQRLAQNCAEPVTCEFLSSMAGAALDPSNPFGSELVHHIATGYVLYAYVGRHDNPDARSAVGSLAGEVAIFDTPILLRLLGAHRDTSPIFDLVRQAREAGVIIIVHQDSVDELNRLLDGREATGIVAKVDEALGHQSDEAILRLGDDHVITAWLESPAAPGKACATWQEFRSAARRLPTILQAMGVEVGQHADYDFEDATCHAQFEARLRERVNEQNRTGRGDWNLAHDARLLVTAKKRRRANPPDESKMWPGAFIVTPDQQLTPTYDEVMSKGDFPVALTPGQWAGVVAGCSDPVSHERLARAIARNESRNAVGTGGYDSHRGSIGDWEVPCEHGCQRRRCRIDPADLRATHQLPTGPTHNVRGRSRAPCRRSPQSSIPSPRACDSPAARVL